MLTGVSLRIYGILLLLVNDRFHNTNTDVFIPYFFL